MYNLDLEPNCSDGINTVIMPPVLFQWNSEFISANRYCTAKGTVNVGGVVYMQLAKLWL